MSPTLLHIILRHSSIIQELGTVLQCGEESFITQIRTKFWTVLYWHPTGCIENQHITFCKGQWEANNSFDATELTKHHQTASH
jgi:hypothetical protein